MPGNVNLSELAKAEGVSLTTVRNWIRRGCPTITRGDKGQPYEFSLEAVRQWRARTYGHGSPQDGRESAPPGWDGALIGSIVVNAGVVEFAKFAAAELKLPEGRLQRIAMRFIGKKPAALIELEAQLTTTKGGR